MKIYKNNKCDFCENEAVYTNNTPYNRPPIQKEQIVYYCEKHSPRGIVDEI